MAIINNESIKNAIILWNQEHPTKSFADSQTQAKTSLLANKIFLSIEENQVRFIELNFLERFLRWAFGLYSTTLFKKEERERIQAIIKDCLNPSSPASSLTPVQISKKKETSFTEASEKPSTDLLVSNNKVSAEVIQNSPVQTTIKRKTINEVFREKIEAAASIAELNLIKLDLRKEIESKESELKKNLIEIENLHILYATAQSKLSVLSGWKYQEDKIPEELLEPVFDIAKYGKENDMGKVRETWTLFHAFLNSNKNEAIRNVNLSLAKEVLLCLRIDYEEIKKRLETVEPKQNSASSQNSINIFKIPCLGIALPEAITQEVEHKLMTMLNHFNSLAANGKTSNIISTYQQVIALGRECKQLQDKVMLSSDVVKTLEEQVGSELRLMGGDSNLVSHYLNPPDLATKLNRLFCHSALSSQHSRFKQFKEQLSYQEELLLETIAKKAEDEYKTIPNPGEGDCFFYSCAQQIDSNLDHAKFRAKIAEELKNNKEKYVASYVTRKRDDDLLNSVNSYEDYCRWIRVRGKWGSGPELLAMSNLSLRPIIFIQKNIYGDTCTVINPQFKAEPLIFNLAHGHYTAYKRIVREETVESSSGL